MPCSTSYMSFKSKCMCVFMCESMCICVCVYLCARESESVCLCAKHEHKASKIKTSVCVCVCMWVCANVVLKREKAWHVHYVAFGHVGLFRHPRIQVSLSLFLYSSVRKGTFACETKHKSRKIRTVKNRLRKIIHNY